MASADEVLGKVVAAIEPVVREAGLTRTRRGVPRGIAWRELGGRRPDGTWLELRMHHSPSTGRLTAGLLAYRPLTQGGRTVVVGEASYDGATPEAISDLSDRIEQWLHRARIATEEYAPQRL